MLFDIFRARVGVVLLNGNNILLIRNTKQSPPTFHLPGDIVKVSETLEAAAKRSVKEQTGLDIELQKLLYVRDDLSENRQRVDIIFLGLLKPEQNLTKKENPNIKVDWVALDILKSINLQPEILKEKILYDYKNKFKTNAKYIKYSPDIL
jgi:ADP-ribose pyrophosphatase YjhB (NUDIX family)